MDQLGFVKAAELRKGESHLLCEITRFSPIAALYFTRSPIEKSETVPIDLAPLRRFERDLPGFSRFLAVRPYGDLHVLIEGGQHPHQALDRVAMEASAQHI